MNLIDNSKKILAELNISMEKKLIKSHKISQYFKVSSNAGWISQFKLIFTKVVKCDSLDAKRYKMGDFEWLGDIVKFIIIMLEFGVASPFAHF